MSWLKEEEYILSINQVPYREPMKTLKCYFFYINTNDYIDHVDIEDIELDPMLDGEVGGGGSWLKSSKLLKIIQSKKIYTSNTKYIFKDLCLFHVDLEPNEIPGFVDCSGNFGDRFFRKIPTVVDDIILPPSIGVFHFVNSLYFFFYENLLQKAREPKSSFTKKRVIGVGSGGGGAKTTRKVSWKTKI
jgi:hypothetical protein